MDIRGRRNDGTAVVAVNTRRQASRRMTYGRVFLSSSARMSIQSAPALWAVHRSSEAPPSPR